MVCHEAKFLSPWHSWDGFSLAARPWNIMRWILSCRTSWNLRDRFSLAARPWNARPVFSLAVRPWHSWDGFSLAARPWNIMRWLFSCRALMECASCFLSRRAPMEYHERILSCRTSWHSWDRFSIAARPWNVRPVFLISLYAHGISWHGFCLAVPHDIHGIVFLLPFAHEMRTCCLFKWNADLLLPHNEALSEFYYHEAELLSLWHSWCCAVWNSLSTTTIAP